MESSSGDRRVKTLRFSLGRHAAAGNGSPQAKRLRVDVNSANGAAAISGDASDEAVVRLVQLIDELATPEASADLHFGLFLWPSALVLARYIAFHHTNRFAGRTVLELGCGIALPGILTAVCGNAKKVLLSDRADSRSIQQNVDANIRLNGIVGVASYLPLNWGSLDLLDLTETLCGVDVILAADCFYQSEDFEKVLATVALVFRLSPQCTFLTAYQLRSINRSIAPLLSRYAMTATILHKRAFMDIDDVPGADSVYVYEIKPV